MRWVAVALLASGAAAECPTMDDLRTGIVIEWDDGERVVLDNLEQSAVVVSTEICPDGSTAIGREVWGLYFLDAPEAADCGAFGFNSYGLEPGEMPRPAPMTRVTFSSVGLGGGYVSVAATLVYESGPVYAIRLADCEYSAFDVRLNTYVAPPGDFADDGRYIPSGIDALDTEPSREYFTYIADLGLSVSRMTTDSGSLSPTGVVSIRPR